MASGQISKASQKARQISVHDRPLRVQSGEAWRPQEFTPDRGSGPTRTRRSKYERASSPVALEQIEARLEPGTQDRVDVALHPHADLTPTDRPGQRQELDHIVLEHPTLDYWHGSVCAATFLFEGDGNEAWRSRRRSSASARCWISAEPAAATATNGVSSSGAEMTCCTHWSITLRNGFPGRNRQVQRLFGLQQDTPPAVEDDLQIVNVLVDLGPDQERASVSAHVTADLDVQTPKSVSREMSCVVRTEVTALLVLRAAKRAFRHPSRHAAIMPGEYDKVSSPRTALTPARSMPTGGSLPSRTARPARGQMRMPRSSSHTLLSAARGGER